MLTVPVWRRALHKRLVDPFENVAEPQHTGDLAPLGYQQRAMAAQGHSVDGLVEGGIKSNILTALGGLHDLTDADLPACPA